MSGQEPGFLAGARDDTRMAAKRYKQEAAKPRAFPPPAVTFQDTALGIDSPTFPNAALFDGYLGNGTLYALGKIRCRRYEFGMERSTQLMSGRVQEV